MKDRSSKATAPVSRGRMPPCIAAVSLGLLSTSATWLIEARTSSRSSISLAKPDQRLRDPAAEHHEGDQPADRDPGIVVQRDIRARA